MFFNGNRNIQADNVLDFSDILNQLNEMSNSRLDNLAGNDSDNDSEMEAYFTKIIHQEMFGYSDDEDDDDEDEAEAILKHINWAMLLDESATLSIEHIQKALEAKKKSVNAMKQELDDYKSMFEIPRLYLSNHFIDLRNQVDKAYTQKLIDKSIDKQVVDNLNKHWLEMINKINEFESDCLKRQKTNNFKQEIEAKNKETIKEIETSLSKTSEEIESMTKKYTNNNKKQSFNNSESLKDLKSIAMPFNFKDTIEERALELNKMLFLNKTMIFIEKSNTKWDRLVLRQFLNGMDAKLRVGKLVAIPNDYFSSKQVYKSFNQRLDMADSLNANLIHLANKWINEFTADPIQEIILTEYIHRLTNCEVQNEVFKNFSQLETLDLSKSNLNKIKKDTFNGLSHLKKLNLSENQLKELDKDAFKDLISLEDLLMRNNRFATFSKSLFSELSNLKSIDCSNNNLEVIYEGTFSVLKNITVVKLSNNRLTRLDQLFRGLTNVDHIDLSRNQLELIDKNAFKDLKKISIIKLNNNNLTRLHKDTFNELMDIKELHLGNNRLEILHKNQFCNLYSLTVLWLCNNDLSYLHPNTFLQLQNLGRIYLNFNRLSNGIDNFLFRECQIDFSDFGYIHHRRRHRRY